MKPLKKILKDDEASEENIFILLKYLIKMLDYKQRVKDALLIGLIEEHALSEVMERGSKTVKKIAAEKGWTVLEYGTKRFYRLTEVNPFLNTAPTEE
jgi:hypothetical protein